MVLKTVLQRAVTTKKTTQKVNFTPNTIFNKKIAAETMNQQVQAPQPQFHCRCVLQKPTKLGGPSTDIKRIQISRSDTDIGWTRISRSDIGLTQVDGSYQSRAGRGIGTSCSNILLAVMYQLYLQDTKNTGTLRTIYHKIPLEALY